MKKQVRKKWSKPVITTTLKIKQTLNKPGDGLDGGGSGLNAS